MGVKGLAVDSNRKLVDSYTAALEQHGVKLERADNMTEAIQKLLDNDGYLYIGINADAVDFLPLLSTMRSVTSTPILIVTSTFTSDAEIAALNNGADLYARWHESTEDNIASVMAHVTHISVRANIPRPPTKIVVYKDLLITPLHRRVFVGNTLIELTRREFDLLHCLAANYDNVLSYTQIYQHVWGDDCYESAKSVLWDTVRRLRGKLKACSGSEYIETVRDFGYRFPFATGI